MSKTYFMYMYMNEPSVHSVNETTGNSSYIGLQYSSGSIVTSTHYDYDVQRILSAFSFVEIDCPI